MIVVRKTNGETVILGTDQEKLLLNAIEHAVYTNLDGDFDRYVRLKSIIDERSVLSEV